MKSVFDIARSHVTFPVSRDGTALRRVLKDWLDYTECQSLQAKPAFPAELCITVHPSVKSMSRVYTQGDPKMSGEVCRRPGEAASLSYTKRVRLLLWSAVLPWEVQRGLSMSVLEPPGNGGSVLGEVGVRHGLGGSGGAVDGGSAVATKGWKEVEDSLGVVTDPTTGTAADFVSGPQCSTLGASIIPGMLFVMSPESAAQGLCFWSGAIRQPIDIAFIAPVEPPAADTPSFSELRQRRLQLSLEGYDISRFFPDGELESPTVTFAVQSHSYLDPFPDCEQRDQQVGCGSSRERNKGIEDSRRYTATPEGVGRGNENVRYVLETRRNLLRDSIRSALRECRCTHGGVVWASNTGCAADGNPTGTGECDVEVTISLTLSDELKEDLREKARLYTNYVVPLEGHVRRHIKCLSGISPHPKGDATDGSDALQQKGTEAVWGEEGYVCTNGSAPFVAPPPIIKPPLPVKVGTLASTRPRSPMLADEAEGRPTRLAPSVFGRHDAPALQRAQQECNQLISASALARIPNTSPRAPEIPPIDYEIFDLCLRLGLCQSEAIYYFYGRIMREWSKELRRLRAAKSHGEGGVNDGNDMVLREEDVHRMLRLVHDPSLQVPPELSACVEAVASLRKITNEVGVPVV